MPTEPTCSRRIGARIEITIKLSCTHNLQLETNRKATYRCVPILFLLSNFPATMKFVGATLTPLLSVRSSSSASEIHIPASANQRLEIKTPDLAEAQVIVCDFLYETSAEDLNIVRNAYNSAYSAIGYSSTASETKRMPVSVPDKELLSAFARGVVGAPTHEVVADINMPKGLLRKQEKQVLFLSKLARPPSLSKRWHHR